MNISPCGTTLHMDACVYQQLLTIRDRFLDGTEGNATLHHDNGRSYRVHLHSNGAFRIVNPTGEGSHCVYTVLEYQSPTSSCSVSSEAQSHPFIILPNGARARARVVAEDFFSRAAIEQMVAYLAILEHSHVIHS